MVTMNNSNFDPDDEDEEFTVDFDEFSDADLGSLKISGASTIQGGILNRDVRVSGVVNIVNDLTCNAFKASGPVNAQGDLIARESIKSSGPFKVAGSLFAEEGARFSGSAVIDRNVHVESLSCSGSMKINGRLDVREGAHFSGSTRIGQDVIIGGKLHASGSFFSGGLLHAGHMSFSSSAATSMGRLSVRTISIRSRRAIEFFTVESIMSSKRAWASSSVPTERKNSSGSLIYQRAVGSSQMPFFSFVRICCGEPFQRKRRRSNFLTL